MLNWTLRKYQSAKYITVSNAGLLAKMPEGALRFRSRRGEMGAARVSARERTENLE